MKNVLRFGSLYFIATLIAISAFAKITTDKIFMDFEKAFIADLWRLFPEWATGVGYHHYDNILTIPDAQSRKSATTFAKTYLNKLKSFNPAHLNPSYRIDYYLIKNQLESIIWSNNTKRDYQWDPSQYNLGELFATMLYEKYAPLENRLKSFYNRLKSVPAYYSAARNNILNPALELQKLSVDQNRGGLAIFEKDFPDSVAKANFSAAEKKEMIAAANKAVETINDFVNWLETLHPVNPRSFRLGSALYEQKFGYNIQSSYTAKELFNKALARKFFIHNEMERLSKELWPKYFGKQPLPSDKLILIRKMIDTLSVQHVQPAEIQQAIEKQLPELVKFINDKNLLYLDPSKPLVVRREPAYMAGVAGASISAPGPYDKNGNTYYNVGSLEGWPAEKAESYLREYNHYILQILNIHEAIPGHYTQLVYSNKSPNLIKSILGNGSMVEGWAVYTEQMMLENGYGGNTPEMWLMWYKWNLRTVCNTILDYSVHTLNMSKENAIKLLTQEAFQQQAEAEGKWRRVSVSSVQLTSYFNGFTEIIRLREDYKKKMGNSYSLKEFNEQFLSYGSAPVKYIRQLMLGN